MLNWWLCLSLGLGLGGVARAQSVDVPVFNAQSYRPPIDARHMLWTDDAGLAASGTWMAKISIGYAKHVLSVTEGLTGEEKYLVDDLAQANLIAGTTLGRFRMGLDLPIFPLVSSEIVDGQAGLGDVGFDLRTTLVDPGDAAVGLALGTRVSAPTSTVDLPLGTGGLGYEVTGIVDTQAGPAHLALNLGYRGVPAAALDVYTVDDQVLTRAGVGLAFSPTFGLSGDIAGHLQLNQPLDNAANGAWEGLLGFWSRMDRFWVVRAGGGGGLTEAIGAPMLRTVLSIGYEPLPDSDTDGDGLLDSRDKCPDRAEDLDGWEDDDGCPDAASPVRVTMRDPYGNPVDEAVVQISSEDGEPREDGGPQFTVGLEPGTYILNAEAAGFDALSEEFVVRQGEAVNLVKVMNPTKPPPRVRVTKKAIRISEKVYFETDSDVLKSESYAILDLVAQTMNKHKDLKVVQVVGHTDSRADASYNQGLSERRARSVLDYLESRGVDSGRLDAVGMGEEKPLDARENEAAWELNRRVEFVIIQRDK